MEYTSQDFKKGQPRWCPGCGDHFFLASLHKAMAEIGVAPHNTVVISGIGCSSRLPHYMATYGMNTIHGRAAAIATGCKVANPDLTVWQVSGDGDGLAIGGNHFIHANRRNINLNMVLLNNRIYGLTKGQYSPTSEKGFISKSSPYGTVEEPFNPAELCFGARGTFFGRAIDVDLKNLTDLMVASAKHKGTSVMEVLQNCVIFNDGIHSKIADKAFRAERTIVLQQGKKMLFGANNEKGIVAEKNLQLKAVTIGQDGYTLDDVLVHDATTKDSTLHFKLARMGYENDLPVALGVIRDVQAPTFEDEYEKQIEEVQKKMPKKTFTDFLMGSDNVWELK